MFVAIALALFTTHKLYTMMRIRGFIGERSIETHVVSDKTTESGRRNRVFCFLVWGEGERQRVQTDCDEWEQVPIGESIEVVRVDDDARSYMRRGGLLYASDGDFGLDLVILGLELGAIIYYSRRREPTAIASASANASAGNRATRR